MTYNNKWLHIAAFNGSNMEIKTNSYLFNITKEQEELFLIFLNELTKHNGYWPCGREKIHTDTLDCKDLYPEVFNNKEVIEYLELISDYFPVLESGFDFLNIDFDKVEYGYNRV